MDITNILKSDYLDLLFDGRNKAYGGYELRNNYPRRARNAAFGTILVAGLIAAGPVIASIIRDKPPTNIIESRRIVELTDPPPIRPDKPLPPPPPPAPPAPSRPTAHFTPPVIRPTDEVREDVRPPDEAKHEIAGLKNETGDAGASELRAPSSGHGDGEVVTETRKEEIFTYVSQMPQFQDGDVNAWLAKHTNYPSAARDNAIEGRVIVTFVVNERGDIGSIEIGRSSGNSHLDNEAKRVVASMPAWTPGKNNGKEVKVQFSLPITFALN